MNELEHKILNDIMKNILILILIAVLVLVSFLLFVKVNLDYQQIKEMKGEQLERDKRYLENLNELMAGYNKLQDEYDKLKEAAYEIEASENLIQKNYQMLKVTATAYTSEECRFITKLGMDLREDYSRYFNIAAVDPKVIPLGSIFLVEINNQIYTFIAVDTGSAIKGNEIDIYLRIPHSEAVKFGRQTVKIWLLSDKKYEWNEGKN